MRSRGALGAGGTNALKSNRGGGGAAVVSSQHLLQSFMSTYKAAGASMRGQSLAGKNDDVVEDIPERQDEDDLDDQGGNK